MVSELFNKPLFPDGTTLAQINASRNYQTEFEFYMIIKNKISFISDVTTILAKNYGTEHPYTQACSRLGNISPGFLKGFIDLLFEHQGKFWVLDYKTNTLDSYRACSDDNLLIDAMAHHNYYLQFILYLVATKRHLEFMYNINDASELLGGAIYLFVRGFYLENSTHNDGILIDTKCIAVVKEVDLLLGGVVYG
jgi:exodeoxyribonuclease V beta subunit